MRRIPALLLAFAGCLACGAPPPERIPAIGETHEGPAYDRLYPEHVEVCAKRPMGCLSAASRRS